jgi:N-acyl-D-amino-acid deacylase
MVKAMRSFLISILLIGSFGAPAAYAAPKYDVVIRGGRLIDGAGNPWSNGDVAVKDGRIVAIGRIDGDGAREIAANGLYVSPGWIDMMDQSARAGLSIGLAENKIRMGVTTAISGEGGVPVKAAELADYFGQLQRRGVSMNFGSYYATHQARIEVMGEQAGAPDSKQMDAMKGRVAQAMEAGAFGVATALIYPPASFQSTQDLIELTRVAARYGGMYASHMRDESVDLLKAIAESIEIAERSGARVEIYHLKAAYAPGWGALMRDAGELIQQARDRGVDIAADVYPYTAGGTGLSVTAPNWIFADGVEKGMTRLADPAVRARLKRELQEGSQPGWSNLVKSAGGWSNVTLANAHSSQYRQYEGMSLQQIAERLERDPADAAWDIVLAARPKRAMGFFHLMSEQDVATALQFPWTSIGSDAGVAERGAVPAEGLAHPRAYGTFPRVIAEYVKRRKVLRLEEAVRKMTSWPAARMGLDGRGLLRPGMYADITVFNLEQLEDTATYENPTAFPTGIEYVLVNGRVVIDKGRHTGARPGRVLRGPGYRQAADADRK